MRFPNRGRSLAKFHLNCSQNGIMPEEAFSHALTKTWNVEKKHHTGVMPESWRFFYQYLLHEIENWKCKQNPMELKHFQTHQKFTPFYSKECIRSAFVSHHSKDFNKFECSQQSVLVKVSKHAEAACVWHVCLPEMNMDLDLNPADFQLFYGFGLDIINSA